MASFLCVTIVHTIDVLARKALFRYIHLASEFSSDGLDLLDSRGTGHVHVVDVGAEKRILTVIPNLLALPTLQPHFDSKQGHHSHNSISCHPPQIPKPHSSMPLMRSVAPQMDPDVFPDDPRPGSITDATVSHTLSLRTTPDSVPPYRDSLLNLATWTEILLPPSFCL